MPEKIAKCCTKCGEKFVPLGDVTDDRGAKRNWCSVCIRLLGYNRFPLPPEKLAGLGLSPSFPVRQERERIPYIRRVESWYEVPGFRTMKVANSIGKALNSVLE